LGADPDYCNYKQRLANRDKLTQVLDGILGGKTTAEWMDQLAGAVPVAPVYDVKQALDNPFIYEQKRVLEASHPARGTISTIACPVRVDGQPDLVGIAPALGEDTEDVLHGLGYDEARIRKLREDRVI
jgi:crotonobetainyl-CoA:carnitine CoA-transferase CaiB-like acyl-CoA transferase